MSKYYPNASATGFDWVKSSYSSGDQSCVEVAKVPGAVPVRDSKNPEGPALAIAPHAWSAFIAFASSDA
ncbi:DUF397 domain-containing protein (plasmid) [Streptomyces sp. NBC_01384]|uniref:DUF397 domain-containing protein n=1 Tax=Streptomyces sp. NBC_01384 TaxID=2903847 RepID=UPI002F90DB0B